MLNKAPEDPLRLSLTKYCMWLKTKTDVEADEDFFAPFLVPLDTILTNHMNGLNAEMDYESDAEEEDLLAGGSGSFTPESGNDGQGGQSSEEEDASEGEGVSYASALQSRPGWGGKVPRMEFRARSKAQIAATRAVALGNVSSSAVKYKSVDSPKRKASRATHAPSSKKRRGMQEVVMDDRTGSNMFKELNKKTKKDEDAEAADRLDKIMSKGQVKWKNPQHYSGPKYVTIFDVDVLDTIQPKTSHLVRQPNAHMVETLVDQMRRRPNAALNPMYIYICNLDCVEDFDISKLNVDGYYEKEVIGGNHSRLASQQVLSRLGPGVSEDTIQNYRWKKAKIFCNLTDVEIKAIGNAHNTDTQFCLDMSLMDQVFSFRNLLYKKDTEEYLDEWIPEDEENPPMCRDDGDIKRLLAWKEICMEAINESRSKVQNHSPALSIARWSKVNFEKALQIDKMVEAGEVKGMAKKKVSKRKASNSAPPKIKRLTNTNLNSLCGLDDAHITSFLNGIIEKETNLAEAGLFAMNQKKKERCMNAWQVLGKCNTIEEAYEKFTYDVMKHSFGSFQQCFSRDTNPEDLPKAFKQYVVKAMTEYDARMKMQAAAEAGAGAVEGEGASASSLWDFHNDEVPHVFLQNTEYRGEDGETTKEETNFTHKDHTSVKLLKADVLKFSDEQTALLRGKYSLVVIDPPYGCTGELWDKDGGWSGEHFKKCVEGVYELNSHLNFTIHSFCGASQLSHFLTALKSLEDKAKGIKVMVHHGAWRKLGAWSNSTYLSSKLYSNLSCGLKLYSTLFYV